jgi:hypothetical protein
MRIRFAFGNIFQRGFLSKTKVQYLYLKPSSAKVFMVSLAWGNAAEEKKNKNWC